jgi:hypothetical protein
VNYSSQATLGDASATNAGVKLLQESLRKLAFAKQQPALDPAAYDGSMNLGTIIALANAAPVLGTSVHPVVGKALQVVDVIRAPIELIPYADGVLDIVLSPWIIDDVYSVILSIIRLFPGGGSAASSIEQAVNAVKSALSTAAAPIAAAVKLVTPATPTPPSTAPGSGPPPMPSGLGEDRPGFTWVPATATVPGHWERLRAGETPNPGPAGSAAPTVRDHRGSTIQVRNPPTTIPNFWGGNSGVIVRDHRAWPKGRLIDPKDWDGTVIYSARVPLEDLHRRDANFWRNATQEGTNNNTAVANGTYPFKIFYSWKNGTLLGAFYNGSTQMLKIVRIPKRPSPAGHWYDFLSDGVDAVVNAASDVADAVTAAWDWVADNAADVYEAIKKYGCIVVNNDIVVAAAAGATSIVATPAAGAAVAAGAGSGRAACAAIAIGEAVYAIIKFLAMDFPPPISLTSPTPPPKVKAGVRDLVEQVSIHPVLSPPIGKYPRACITRLNTTRNTWSVYCPPSTQLGGSNMLTAYELSPATVGPSSPSPTPTKGSGIPTRGGFQPTTTPTKPTSPFVLPERETKPTSTTTPDAMPPAMAPTCPEGSAFDPATNQCVITAPAFPATEVAFYQKPMFWAALAGGVAVIGTGSYFIFRRKRTPVAGRRR